MIKYITHVQRRTKALMIFSMKLFPIVNEKHSTYTEYSMRYTKTILIVFHRTILRMD